MYLGVDYIAVEIKDTYRHRLGTYLAAITGLIIATTARELVMIYNAKGWSKKDTEVIVSTIPGIAMATDDDNLKDILHRLEHNKL